MRNPLKIIKDELFELKRWSKLVYSYPKMNITKVDYDAYWESKRGAEIGRLSDWQQIRANTIIKRILPGTSILDIGCGDGSILTYIASKIKVGDMYGADSSTKALDNLKNIQGFKLDISSTDSLRTLPDADYVLLLEILEHIMNPEEVLHLLYKKANKGVFFSFPNTGFFVYRLRLLFGRTPMQWRLHPSEHVRFWTLIDLKWWLTQLGYMHTSEIIFYKGVPILKNIWPSLFAAGFIVSLQKRMQD
jgi:2-polyprenyl-3-methyl-5-hydroxy-6-metoxy-1,4-benzoquinol methylase